MVVVAVLTAANLAVLLAWLVIGWRVMMAHERLASAVEAITRRDPKDFFRKGPPEG